MAASRNALSIAVLIPCTKVGQRSRCGMNTRSSKLSALSPKPRNKALGAGSFITAGSSRATIGSAAVPSLIEALSDQDEDLRWRAATALGEIGPSAKDAVPALIEAKGDSSEWVRTRAAGSLEKIER